MLHTPGSTNLLRPADWAEASDETNSLATAFLNLRGTANTVKKFGFGVNTVAFLNCHSNTVLKDRCGRRYRLPLPTKDTSPAGGPDWFFGLYSIQQQTAYRGRDSYRS